MKARVSEAFVGRVHELEQLEKALAAGATGHGATVLVTGEAGIGKTRLASEVIQRADEVGFEVLIGRSIDLLGTDLSYQPFVEALRPLGTLPGADSQSRFFEETLARLGERAAVVPLLLVLEDVHWADASSLDLLVYLSHHVHDRRILALATCRADDVSSAERMRRLADGLRRSGSALTVHLGPLGVTELSTLLAARAQAPPTPAVMRSILARAEGNPFFAEELLVAADAGSGELPARLLDVLTSRLAGLDPTARSLVRLVAAAGRDVSFGLLVAVAALGERDVSASLRAAVEHGVLIADPDSERLRFRHPLLSEAVYATILPGEREWLHGRIADELARARRAAPAELAPHWALAGRSRDALSASMAAAGEAESVFGLAEALGHLERAISLWDDVSDAEDLTGFDLAELCARAAGLASQVGDDPRALELGTRAVELAGEEDALRASRLLDRMGEYLNGLGRTDAALAAFRHAVEILPTGLSAQHAYALGTLSGAVMMGHRYAESLDLAEQALGEARAVGAREAEVRALTVVGVDTAHLGRPTEGVALLRDALRLAEESGDLWGLDRGYVNLTDALMTAGRLREAVTLGREGIDVLRTRGIHSPLLVSNMIEALLAIGEWDRADALSTTALHDTATSFEHVLLAVRADLESGRGDFKAARGHLEAARTATRQSPDLTMLCGCAAGLALWQRRWSVADEAVGEGLAGTGAHESPHLTVWLCALGLRAAAELAALARARRDPDALTAALDRATALLAAARVDEASYSPNVAGWRALARAEHERAHGDVSPDRWSDTAEQWERIEWVPLAAYCRWRHSEALVAAGASRDQASLPLRAAHAVALRLRARPLLSEIELFAQRARLDPTPLPSGHGTAISPLQELGLTSREAEVLALVARGLTNRDIAETLVISVKTAGVHVSNILRKLDVPNRQEAAAIAHRLTPPDGGN
jgi:DNA-binding NarL/FixJ family response regulator